MGSLKGKRALVTAGGQGIGRRIVEDLLAAGCDVAVHYHTSREGADEVVALAASLGRRAGAFQADLTVESEGAACVNEAAEFLGGLEVLVNNAGALVERRWLSDLDVEFWHRVMDINVTSMQIVTREAVPHLAKCEEGSSIVNIASLAGRKGGHAGSLVYATSKGAVLTYTRALSTELAPLGIRVNAVAPGLILGTDFHRIHTTKESAEATIRNTPLGRAGEPGDVSRPVLFLASEYDGYITGATLDINGGVYCA